MTSNQKLIKIFAIALAMFIITGASLGVFGIFSSLMGIQRKEDNTVTFEYENANGNENVTINESISSGENEHHQNNHFDFDAAFDYSYDNGTTDEVRVLDIKVLLADLVIVVGDSFSVAGSDENISVSQNGSKLVINEKKIYDIFKSDRSVVITVPSDKLFERVRIDAGAGEITAELISASTVNFNFGAGDVHIEHLFVSDKALINAGVGAFSVSEATVNNLDMHFGVSDVRISGVLFGKTDIDCGVGNIELSLKGSEADYRIDMDKGTGKATLNGKTLEDDVTYGSGNSEISFDGGVGNVVIKTEY